MTGLGYGWRLSADFMAAVLVGGGLGWMADSVLGTRPWGLIAGLFLGLGAGLNNVLRLARKMQMAGPAEQSSKTPEED